jgi:hypothetical protein
LRDLSFWKVIFELGNPHVELIIGCRNIVSAAISDCLDLGGWGTMSELGVLSRVW